MNHLKTIFCEVAFPNPLILPSGIAQEIPSDHVRAIEGGAGGITTKSLTVEPREGNPIPRVVRVVSDGEGIMNSVGLRGPGLVKGITLIREFIKSSTVPVIVSIFAAKISDFEKLARAIIPLKPACLELNLSCPNVDDEFGKPLGMGASSTAGVIKAIKKISPKVPLLAKLTPNVTNIAEIAKACEESGADGIVAINTVGPGMAIDIAKRQPILGAKRGGVSGKIIKPIAIRCVYDIYESVKIPIIGMGGVSTWQDAVEMMMAGASLVGVGSATYYHGMKVFKEIAGGLEKYMDDNKIENLKEIVGAAHNNNN
jgi:dihydroorotate dehydrogenase (NAD+) catalytic subunit